MKIRALVLLLAVFGFLLASQIAFAQDTTPPSVTAGIIKLGGSASTTVDGIYASANDPSGVPRIDLYLDNALVKSCTGPAYTDASCVFYFTFVPSTGTHMYYATATDAYGNVGRDPATGTKSFIVDTTPPTVSVSHSPTSPTKTDTVTIFASASDSSGVGSISVYIDSNLARTCSSTTSCAVSTVFTIGTHTYYAKATDGLGNTAQSSTVTFTVVSTPSVSVSHSPQSPTTSDTVTFTATSNVVLNYIQIAVDGLVQTSCYYPATSCTYSSRFSAGTHTYYAYGADGYNIYYDPATGTKSFTVTSTAPTSCSDGTAINSCSATKPKYCTSSGTLTDLCSTCGCPSGQACNTATYTCYTPDTTPPSVSVVHSPLNQITGGVVNITATASDANGVSSIEIFVDDISRKVCTSATTCYFGIAYYYSSTHTYYAVAKDAAGNTARDPASGTKSFTVTQVDTTPPTVTAAHTPTAPTISDTVTITASASDASGIYSIEILVDGASVNICPSSTCTYSSTFSAGAHSYYARATDTSLNVGSASQSTFTVTQPPTPDTTPPSVSISHLPTSNLLPTSTITITATASDSSGISSISIFVSSATSTALSKVCTVSPCNYSNNYDPGTYTYYATATDKAGNGAKTATGNLVVQSPPDTTPPIVSSVSVQSITSTSATITWITDELGTSYVSYGTPSQYASATNSSISNTTLTTYHTVIIGGLSPSTLYYFRVYSYDASKNLGGSNQMQFTTAPAPDTTPPIINTTASQPTYENSQTQIFIEATDPSGISNIELYVDNVKKELLSCSSTGQGGTRCGYSMQLKQGTHYYYGTATDRAGNTARSPATGGNAIVVQPPYSEPYSFTVISPNGGETWQLGSWQTVKWSSKNLPASATVIIELVTFGGYQGTRITNNAPNTGTYSFNLNNILTSSSSGVPPGIYQIWVHASYDYHYPDDYSDEPFRIVAAPNATNATATCTDSDGGQNYYVKGITSGIYNGILGFSDDYCHDVSLEGHDLTEFYCINSTHYDAIGYKCPYGCSNGACLPSPTSAIDISTTSSLTGTAGQYMGASFEANGGTTPYTWTITSGNLPPGISLQQCGEAGCPENANDIVISGAPTSSGTYGFTLTASDSSGKVGSQSFTFIISVASTTAPKVTMDQMLQISLELEGTKAELDRLQRDAISLANYYGSVGDFANADKFSTVADMLGQAKSMVDSMQAKIRANINNPDAIADELRQDVQNLKAFINQITEFITTPAEQERERNVGGELVQELA